MEDLHSELDCAKDAAKAERQLHKAELQAASTSAKDRSNFKDRQVLVPEVQTVEATGGHAEVSKVVALHAADVATVSPDQKASSRGGEAASAKEEHKAKDKAEATQKPKSEPTQNKKSKKGKIAADAAPAEEPSPPHSCEPETPAEDIDAILEAAMIESKLDAQIILALQWCRSRKVVTMAALLDSFESDLVPTLGLKNLQSRRLLRILREYSADGGRPMPPPKLDRRVSEALPPVNKTEELALVKAHTHTGSNEAEMRQQRQQARKAKKNETTAIVKAEPQVKETQLALLRRGFVFDPPGPEELAEPRTVTLSMGLEGAGMDFHATWYGMIIKEIDEDPGQPDLSIGDCIISIAGESLQERPEECEDAFAMAIDDDVEVVVEPRCEAYGDLSLCIGSDLDHLQADLEQFGADFEVSFDVLPGTTILSMSGARSAVIAARADATQLIQVYIPALEVD